MGIIEYLDQHNGFIMAILTFVYVVFTILIFRANSKSVKEMKVTREDENRPYIVTYIKSQPKGTVELFIENIGKTVARNIEISITPEFQFPKERPLSKSTLLNNPIPNMPPNYKYSMFVGMYWDFKNEDRTYPVFEVEVNYEDSNDKSFTEQFIIDLNVGSDTTHLVEKGIHDLTKEFITFRKNFQKVQGDISDIKNNIRKDDDSKKQIIDYDQIL